MALNADDLDTSREPPSPAPGRPAQTASGGDEGHADGASASSWASAPLDNANAPTAAVPLIQGTAAQSYGRRRGHDGVATAGRAAANAAGRVPGRPRRPGRAGKRGPRRAQLQLRHINPWTVLKFSCVLSIALFFVWLIVVGVLFGILDGAGVIGKINDAYTTIQGADSQPPVTAGVVFGGAAIIGVVNIVLFIALSHGRVGHLQPLRRPGRRHRDHAVRTLSAHARAPAGARRPVWSALPRPGRLTLRVRGPVAQTVRAHP